MADLALSPEALEVYNDLDGDPSRWAVLDDVEEALDAIQTDPGGRSSRARKFNDPPCFAVPFGTNEGQWLILWREVADGAEFDNLEPGDVYVLYIGPVPGA